MKKYLIGRSSYQGGEEKEEPPQQSSDEQFMGRLVKKRKFEMEHDKKDLSVVNAHERDLRIKFVEKGHYYEKEGGGRFSISVSGIKGFIFPPFSEEDTIASKFQNPQKDKDGNLILKNGRAIVGRSAKARVDPEDYGLTRRECIEKQRGASASGTLVHLKAEKYLNLQLPPGMPQERRMAHFLQKADFTEEEFNEAKQIIDAESQWIREGWTIFRTEWSIFCEKFDYAGQIDVVLRRPSAGGGWEYAILDWKTTRHAMSSCFSWNKFPNAFYPFDEFPATLGNAYLFQMALYAHTLIHEYGLNVVMVRAIGIHKRKRAGEIKTWTEIPLQEVSAVLAMYREFKDLERLIKDWEENGHTANGLFPTLREPPFFKKLPDDP